MALAAIGTRAAAGAATEAARINEIATEVRTRIRLTSNRDENRPETCDPILVPLLNGDEAASDAAFQADDAP